MRIGLTLAILWLGHFLVDFMIAIFPVYKTVVQMDLGFAAAVASISALVGEATQLLFGALSDRGFRRVCIGSGIALSCTAAGMVYLEASPWIFALVLLTYIGSAAFHPAAAALAGSLSTRRKGLFITLFASGGSVGMALGQLGFYESYQRLGQWVGLLAIPSLLLVGILCLFPIREDRSSTSGRFTIQGMLGLFRRVDLRWLYVALVANTTVFFGFFFLLPDLLVSRGYPDWICFGGGSLSMIMGAAIMMVPGGFLADRYTSRPVLLVSILGGLALFYLFLLSPTLDDAILLTMLFCLGSLFGVVHPVGVALANTLLPQNPGLVSAFAMGMVWCVAECLGPASASLTKLFAPEDAPTSALLILATMNFLGAAAAWALPQQGLEPSWRRE